MNDPLERSQDAWRAGFSPLLGAGPLLRLGTDSCLKQSFTGMSSGRWSV